MGFRMLVLSGFVGDCSSEQDRPQMGLIAAVALITIILASMLCVLVLRQLTRVKKSRSSSEATLSVEHVPPGYEYEVFLSFRGSDTRNNFTDCLYRGLRNAGVHVFLDNEELRVGKEIGGELLKALNKSQIYIPIFSQNYATSSWCLREVAHMVECTSKSNGKKEILPIFYDVSSDDVKLKTKLYRKAIQRHKKKFGSNALKWWEEALVKVAHLKGWNLKGKCHGELIELVVGEVLCKLNTRNVDVPEYWVEDHRQIEDILEKLEVDSDDVCFLGIHGIGGIGKTVLAKVVFNKLSSHFEGVCFLNDVRESSQHGLVNMQKKLLASFVGPVLADVIKDIGDGMKWIKRVCHTKKVLIVLDDLDKQEQLKKLAGKSDWFGLGSRIIFTTRNLEVLMTQVESSGEEVLNQPKGILAYEAHAMEYGRALQLFCKHAFRRDSPLEGYDNLTKEIVRRVGMLPLAVEVIGSFFYCQSFALGKHFDKRKLWEGMLKQLDDGPFKDVRDALMISYEGLENKQKEVFLDIACLFTNKDQTYPIIMWDNCNYHPHLAIGVLRQRSLIKIGCDNKFWMHDQVRDLGRHIMREEYPRKFSRVWIYNDAIELLGRKQTNQDVEVLSLTSDGCSRDIVPEELAALPNLRFLRVKGIEFIGNFENLVLKLCWLSWEVMHNKFCAKNIHFVSLVVLDLSGSNIEDNWDGWSQFQMTKNLKVLDLTRCTKLTRTPDFSDFVSLEVLILSDCKLITIDGSVGKLELLNTLNIEGCKYLGQLPALHSSTQIVRDSSTQIFTDQECFKNHLRELLYIQKAALSFIEKFSVPWQPR
ncbi:disease resistance protein RUN1-like isoform X1 [Eucalyptus grandis]|uniref:disease resistance protein RUN1-like isoform X1 n=1 Tax=Eucalyptus grandis TaxID=71139 RepID=UPI00192F02D7|nr:disease resistance protein RUN1-like isoform X1 [Eucalyptus grandis]